MPNDFDEATGHFPIRQQRGDDHSINRAVRLLRNVAETDANYWRARAWLSYACVTAVIDDWEHSDNAWGELAGLNDQELLDFAVTEARRALTGARAVPGRPHEYDARWALAFAYLNNRMQSRAITEYVQALNTNELPNRRYRDVALLAEAADSFVYLGRLQSTAGTGPGARELIDEALRIAGSQPPDWFLWVDAWVAVGEAAQLQGQDRKEKLKAAIKTLKALIRDGTNTPEDFDAVVLLAVAKQLKAEGSDKDEARQHRLDHQAEARGRKGNRDWTQAKELRRSPFLNTAGEDAASKAYRDFNAALTEIFKP